MSEQISDAVWEQLQQSPDSPTDISDETFSQIEGDYKDWQGPSSYRPQTRLERLGVQQGSFLDKADATVKSIIQGASLGTADDIIEFLGDSQYEADLQSARERMPWLTTGFEIAGSIPTFLLAPGASSLRAGATGKSLKAVPPGSLNRKLHQLGYSMSQGGRLSRIGASAPVVYGAEGLAYGALYGATEGESWDEVFNGGLIGGGAILGLVTLGKGAGVAGRFVAQRVANNRVVLQTKAQQQIDQLIDSRLDEMFTGDQFGFTKGPASGKFRPIGPLSEAAMLKSLAREGGAETFALRSFAKAYDEALSTPIKTGNTVHAVEAPLNTYKQTLNKFKVLDEGLLTDIDIFPANATLKEAWEAKQFLRELQNVGVVTPKQHKELLAAINKDIRNSVKGTERLKQIDELISLESQYLQQMKTAAAKRYFQNEESAARFVDDVLAGKVKPEQVSDLLKTAGVTARGLKTGTDVFDTQDLLFIDVVKRWQADPAAMHKAIKKQPETVRALLGNAGIKEVEKAVKYLEKMKVNGDRFLGANFVRNESLIAGLSIGGALGAIAGGPAGIVYGLAAYFGFKTLASQQFDRLLLAMTKNKKFQALVQKLFSKKKEDVSPDESQQMKSTIQRIITAGVVS